MPHSNILDVSLVRDFHEAHPDRAGGFPVNVHSGKGNVVAVAGSSRYFALSPPLGALLTMCNGQGKASFFPTLHLLDMHTSHLSPVIILPYFNPDNTQITFQLDI